MLAHEGQWSASELSGNINYLELKAVCLGMMTFRELLKDKRVIIRSDSSPTVA
jgi:hypothetical protein